MSKVFGWIFAVMVMVSLSGCKSIQAGYAMPCEDCKYGVRSVGKGSPPRFFCVVDGKEVDCTTKQIGCPECAKAHK